MPTRRCNLEMPISKHEKKPPTESEMAAGSARRSPSGERDRGLRTQPLPGPQKNIATRIERGGKNLSVFRVPRLPWKRMDRWCGKLEIRNSKSEISSKSQTQKPKPQSQDSDALSPSNNGSEWATRNGGKLEILNSKSETNSNDAMPKPENRTNVQRGKDNC